jgi:hypothetical protein
MKDYLRLLLRNKPELQIIVPASLVLLVGVWTKTEHSLSIVRMLPLTAWTLTLAVIVLSILSYILSEYTTTKSWIRLTMYGVCWDNKANPHCPVCKNALINPVTGKDYDLRCAKCKQDMRLRLDNHAHISIPDARKEVRKRLGIKEKS